MWDMRQVTVDGKQMWGIFLNGKREQTCGSWIGAKLWGIFNNKGWLPVVGS